MYGAVVLTVCGFFLVRVEVECGLLDGALDVLSNPQLTKETKPSTPNTQTLPVTFPQLGNSIFSNDISNKQTPKLFPFEGTNSVFAKASVELSNPLKFNGIATSAPELSKSVFTNAPTNGNALDNRYDVHEEVKACPVQALKKKSFFMQVQPVRPDNEVKDEEQIVYYTESNSSCK